MVQAGGCFQPVGNDWGPDAKRQQTVERDCCSQPSDTTVERPMISALHVAPPALHAPAVAYPKAPAKKRVSSLPGGGEGGGAKRDHDHRKQAHLQPHTTLPSLCDGVSVCMATPIT